VRFAPFLVAIVAGLAQAVSIAAPWNGEPQWWLQIVSLGVLVLLLQRTKSWPFAALLGWLF
jgi:apolipoprotein N-acyltransferase